MDHADFRRMVAEYEHTSRHDPRRFALVTAGLAAFGYASILGALGLSIVVLKWGVGRLVEGRFNLGLLILMVGCASLLWSLIGALWARQQAPEGVAITREQAPRLFDLIEKVRRKSGAPAPDVVLLDGELNAAILQQPRLGLLGWHRNTLILGLPMLMALSVKQLAAVIAHEFGHLQGAHGKLGAWVYRTRRSWWVLAARLRAVAPAGVRGRRRGAPDGGRTARGRWADRHERAGQVSARPFLAGGVREGVQDRNAGRSTLPPDAQTHS
jgi:Zn-dependent protease with chaperone function